MPISYATAIVLWEVLTRTKIDHSLPDLLRAYGHSNDATRFEHIDSPGYGYGTITRESLWRDELFQQARFGRSDMPLHLAEAILNEVTADVRVLRPYVDVFTQRRVGDLQGLLQRDGYTFRDGKLWPSEAGVLNVEEERGIVERLIDAHPELSPTLKTHLGASLDHQSAQRPKEAVARARDLLEQLMADIAQAAARAHGKTPPVPKPGEGGQLRQLLVDEGFLTDREARDLVKPAWDFSGLWGNHRWIPDAKIARVGLAHILTVVFYLLEKFGEWKANGFPL